MKLKKRETLVCIKKLCPYCFHNKAWRKTGINNKGISCCKCKRKIE